MGKNDIRIYMIYKLKEELLEFVKSVESFESVPKVGLIHKNPIIGYGHIIEPQDTYNKVTKEQAIEILKKDLVNIIQNIKNVNTINLKDHEIDALGSFALSLGNKIFQNTKIFSIICKGKDIYPNYTDEQYKKLIIDNMSIWYFIGNEEPEILKARRKKETDLFKNGYVEKAKLKTKQKKQVNA